MHHSWYQELFIGIWSGFAVLLVFPYSWHQEPVVKLRGIRNHPLEFRGIRNRFSWYQEPSFVVSGTGGDSRERFSLLQTTTWRFSDHA